jgi:hypothetical protein
MDNNELQHFGVLGMHWGHRKAQTGGGAGKKGVTDHPLFKNVVFNKDASLLTKAGRENFKKNVAKGKNIFDGISNTTWFKSTIYNKDTSLFSSKGRANYGREEINAGKKLVSKLKEKIERGQVRSAQKEIKLFNSIVDGYKNTAKTKTLSARDIKIMKEHEQAAKDLQKELDGLFTKEEQKKWASS